MKKKNKDEEIRKIIYRIEGREVSKEVYDEFSKILEEGTRFTKKNRDKFKYL